MCSSPIKKDGVTFACNRCNDCVNTKITAWVSRAMAEKNTSENSYLLALTYGNASQESRDGSRVFRYSDIQKFIKSIKDAYRASEAKRLGVPISEVPSRASVRYIVCGELGSKFGRVHWHVVLYTQIDMLALGDWFSFVSKKPITKKEEKITTDPNKAKRVLWSCWPQGLLTVQIPDQGGMAYALKYALKDQFVAVKSQGTMREAKADNFGSGFFRMSKKPPIGANWLFQKLERLDQLGAVLPSIKLRIPDCSGYYYPSGYMRDALLDGLRYINERVIEKTGTNAPQWRSLLASVVNQPLIWERLQSEQKEESDLVEFARELQTKQREFAFKQWATSVRSRCGNLSPCVACTNGLSDARVNELERYIRYAVKAHGSYRLAQKHHKRSRVCNPFCGLVAVAGRERAFNKIT